MPSHSPDQPSNHGPKTLLLVAIVFVVVLTLFYFVGSPEAEAGETELDGKLFFIKTRSGRLAALVVVCFGLLAVALAVVRSGRSGAPRTKSDDVASEAQSGDDPLADADEVRDGASVSGNSTPEPGIDHATQQTETVPDATLLRVEVLRESEARWRVTACLLVLAALLDDRIRSLTVTVCAIRDEGDPKVYFEKYLDAVETEHRNARWLEQMEWWRDVVTGPLREYYPDLTVPGSGIDHEIKRACRKVEEARTHLNRFATASGGRARLQRSLERHLETFERVNHLLNDAVELLTPVRNRIRSVVLPAPSSVAHPTAPKTPTPNRAGGAP